MAEYDLISKTALLEHLDMAMECENCPRNADKELYKCVHNPTPERCTCSEIAQICIRITDFEVSTDVQPVKRGAWISYNWHEGIFDGWGMQCDQCLEKYKYGLRRKNFCPNCGARMDES